MSVRSGHLPSVGINEATNRAHVDQSKSRDDDGRIRRPRRGIIGISPQSDTKVS